MWRTPTDDGEREFVKLNKAAVIAVSVYLSDLGVNQLLLLCLLQYGADFGDIGVDLLVQLPAFLRQSAFVLVYLLQSVEQFFELGMKLLQSIFARQLRQRLHLQQAHTRNSNRQRTHYSRRWLQVFVR